MCWSVEEAAHDTQLYTVLLLIDSRGKLYSCYSYVLQAPLVAVNRMSDFDIPGSHVRYYA
jgi:hypothetical protein